MVIKPLIKSANLSRFYREMKESIRMKAKRVEKVQDKYLTESNIKKVYQYIKNQKMKHRDKSFSDELESFRKLHDIG